MKTKQIVFTKAYTAELLDVDYEAPKAGEVTVDLDYSAISAGTEKANFIGARNGTHLAEDEEAVFPRTVGYSAAGIVRAVGDGVRERHAELDDVGAVREQRVGGLLARGEGRIAHREVGDERRTARRPRSFKAFLDSVHFQFSFSFHKPY